MPEEKPKLLNATLIAKVLIVVILAVIVFMIPGDLIRTEAQCQEIADSAQRQVCVDNIKSCLEKTSVERSDCIAAMQANQNRLILDFNSKLFILVGLIVVVFLLPGFISVYIAKKKAEPYRITWTDTKPDEELHADLRHWMTVQGGFPDMNINVPLNLHKLKRGEIGIAVLDRPNGKYFSFFNPSKKAKYVGLTSPILLDELWHALGAKDMYDAGDKVFPVAEKPMFMELLEQYGDELKQFMAITKGGGS